MMRKTTLRIIAVIAAFILCLAFAACSDSDRGNNNNTDPPGTEEPETPPEKNPDDPTPPTPDDPTPPEPEINVTFEVTPADGGTANLCNAEVAEFVADFSKNITSGDKYANKPDHFLNDGLTLSWTSSETPLYYTVKLSEKQDLSDASIYATTQNSLHVDDLFVETEYFWQVRADFAEYSVASQVYSFKTAKGFRTADIEGVSNARDLGGSLGLDGKRIKQGMVYRTATLDGITEKGKIAALKRYGIKTDLDLRSNGEGTAGKASPISSTINYVHVSGAPYYYTNPIYATYGVNISDNWQYLRQEIQVFANRDNYPIVFHCSLGRDRTGTLAVILKALLGVKELEIQMDYEMSAFALVACAGHTYEDLYQSAYGQLTNYLAVYGNGNLAQNTEKFLLDVGVTSEEIQSIREILLG